jgi:hypothetical protein
MCYSVIKCLCTPVCVTLPIHHVSVSPVFLSCCLSSCVFCPCVIILNALHLYACAVPVCDYVFSYTYFILCFFLCSLLSVSFCCLLTITHYMYAHLSLCFSSANIVANVCNYPCLLSSETFFKFFFCYISLIHIVLHVSKKIS